MSVYKRKTSKGITPEYHYKFMQSGKWYYGVCEGCTTKEAAQKYEADKKKIAKNLAEQKTIMAMHENRRQELTGGTAIALSNAMRLMLDKPHKKSRSQKVVDQKYSFWRDWLAFMTAKYPKITGIHEVTQKHAEAYISYLQNNGRFDKNVVMTIPHKKAKDKTRTVKRNYYLSNRTIIKMAQTLKEVFERLRTDAGLIVNPFQGVELPNNDSISRAAYSDEELQLIAKNMTMPYIKPIFTIGLCTGLTLGDICLLRWDEINNGWIDNKRRRKTGAMLDIPIMPPLAALLSELGSKNEFVAPELAEMYQKNPFGVNYRVRKFLESIGIETTTRPDAPNNGDCADDGEELQRRAIATKAAHALRHTFAYLAGVYEVPLPIVQSVLGHMTPEMTQLYQKHASRADKLRFFKKMPDILAAPKSESKQLAAPVTEPERAELHRRINELPIDRIIELLKQI